MLKHGPITGCAGNGPKGPWETATRRGSHGHSWSFPAQPVFGPAFTPGSAVVSPVPRGSSSMPGDSSSVIRSNRSTTVPRAWCSRWLRMYSFTHSNCRVPKLTTP